MECPSFQIQIENWTSGFQFWTPYSFCHLKTGQVQLWLFPVLEWSDSHSYFIIPCCKHLESNSQAWASTGFFQGRERSNIFGLIKKHLKPDLIGTQAPEKTPNSPNFKNQRGWGQVPPLPAPWDAHVPTKLKVARSCVLNTAFS